MLRILFSFMCICIFSSMLHAQAYPDRHSTSFTDAWLSCQMVESPNVKRQEGHWILYDFGDQYALQTSKVWNYNVPSETTKGARDIVIDYSQDGTDWIEFGSFTLSEAPGSTIYEGHNGPDFSGLLARYVLVTIENNYGDSDCAGFGELRINASISTSTSTPQKELSVELMASPNPASEYTTINISELTTDMKYNLTDMSGRQVMAGDIISENHTLDISSLTAGTYTYTAYNSEGQKAILINILNN